MFILFAYLTRIFFFKFLGEDETAHSTLHVLHFCFELSSSFRFTYFAHNEQDP